jgi:hypothetical protein
MEEADLWQGYLLHQSGGGAKCLSLFTDGKTIELMPNPEDMKAMAIAAGAGAGLIAAVVGLLVMLLQP